MSPDASRPLVLLVEDAVLMRMELADMLESGGFRVLPVASAEEALHVLRTMPEVQAVVTDVTLSPSGMDGVELARRVRRERGLDVVVISGQVIPDDDLPSSVYFLSKPVHEATLLHLVRTAMPSGVPETFSAQRAAASPRETTSREADEGWGLTPRQHEVLELLVQGKSNRDIAEALGLSENTVKVHLVAIFKVLGVSSRTEALLAGLRRIQGKPRQSS
jgi:DNA-binding NarL/FixJ family response regulator